MKIPFEEHPFRFELLRARQLSAAHDEMKRMINGVIVPEFQKVIEFLIQHSHPWDINTHGHGVVFNFGKPDKPYTIAYYGYPEDNEFELAVSSDDETTENYRIPFRKVKPTEIRMMFEEFFDAHVPELYFFAEHQDFELHDLELEGPFQLRIEDGGASSIIATVEDLEEILTMATTVAGSFREKDLVITDEKGKVIC